MNFKTLTASLAALLVLGYLFIKSYMNADLLGGANYLSRATRAFEDIEIKTLEHGVKYIEAQTFNGGLYGIGVVHARDRLWQMHFFRILASGRLSEVSLIIAEEYVQLIGSEAIEIDIMVRNIGLNRIAKRMTETLPEADRQM